MRSNLWRLRFMWVFVMRQVYKQYGGHLSLGMGGQEISLGLLVASIVQFHVSFGCNAFIPSLCFSVGGTCRLDCIFINIIFSLLIIKKERKKNGELQVPTPQPIYSFTAYCPSILHKWLGRSKIIMILSTVHEVIQNSHWKIQVFNQETTNGRLIKEHQQ